MWISRWFWSFGVFFLLTCGTGVPTAQAGFWDWFKGHKEKTNSSSSADTQPELSELSDASDEGVLLPLGKFESKIGWSVLQDLVIENLLGEVSVVPTDDHSAYLSGVLTGTKQGARLKIESESSTGAMILRIVYPQGGTQPGHNTVSVSGRKYSGNSVSIVMSGGKSTVMIDGKVVLDENKASDADGEFSFTLHVPRGLLRNLQVDARKIASREWRDQIPRRADFQFTSDLNVERFDASEGLIATTSSGETRVRSVRGPVSLESTSGPTQVNDIQGSVAIKSTSGQIHFTDVTEAWVSTTSGRVRAEMIQGDFRVSTTSGRQTFSNVGGHAELESTSGDIELNQVSGDLRLRTLSGFVQIQEVGGHADLASTSGDFEVAGARGHLKVETTSGHIGLDNPNALSENIKTLSGDVSGKRHKPGPAFATQTPQPTRRCLEVLKNLKRK